MPSVELTEQEWQQLMALLAEAPWRVANPLLMRIGQQLNAQTTPKQPAPRADGPYQEKHNG